MKQNAKYNGICIATLLIGHKHSFRISSGQEEKRREKKDHHQQKRGGIGTKSQMNPDLRWATYEQDFGFTSNCLYWKRFKLIQASMLNTVSMYLLNMPLAQVWGTYMCLWQAIFWLLYKSISHKQENNFPVCGIQYQSDLSTDRNCQLTFHKCLWPNSEKPLNNLKPS